MGHTAPIHIIGRTQPITDFKFGLLMEFCQLGSLEDYMVNRFQCEPGCLSPKQPTDGPELLTSRTTSIGSDEGAIDDSVRSRIWLERVRQFASEILCALDFLHNQKSVIYRDTKPDNVFIVGTLEEPHVKLGDFGMSKVVSPLNRAVTVGGTLFFAA